MKGLKRILCIITALAIAMAVFGCAKKEVTTKPSSSENISVTVNIDGSEGEDKAISASMAVDLTSGSTAYDALKVVCDANKLEITGDPSYVKTIGGLGEGSFGATACGWMYDINGEFPTSSANECVLNDGDILTWAFVK